MDKKILYQTRQPREESLTIIVKTVFAGKWNTIFEMISKLELPAGHEA